MAIFNKVSYQTKAVCAISPLSVRPTGTNIMHLDTITISHQTKYHLNTRRITSCQFLIICPWDKTACGKSTHGSTILSNRTPASPKKKCSVNPITVNGISRLSLLPTNQFQTITNRLPWQPCCDTVRKEAPGSSE